MNSLEIKDKKNQLKAEARSIIEKCKQEVRDLTEEETQELENIKGEIAKLDNELEALKKRLENLNFEDEEQADEEPAQEDEKTSQDKEEKNKHNVMKKEKFSLIKTIRKIANNQPLNDVELAVINAGQEEARRSGLNSQGQIQLPAETRATVTVTAEGEDVVATDIMDILTPLRSESVLAKLGMKFYTNLTGNVQIPVMSGNNVGWASEIGNAGDANVSFDSVTLSPKRITAYVDISKQMLSQTSAQVENAIKDDIVKAITEKLESTVLSTTTDADKPEGLMGAIECAVVSDFEGIAEAEAAIEDANVSNAKYCVSPKFKAWLRSLPINGAGSATVYSNGEVDGTECVVTSAMTTDPRCAFGDFSNYAVGQWGNIDITVDPYTKAAAGQIRLVVNAYFDGKVMRPNAFVKIIKDITTP